MALVNTDSIWRDRNVARLFTVHRWLWFAYVVLIALACFSHISKFEPEFCIDPARKVMYEQPENSSCAVRARLTETDQLHLLKKLHSKATGAQKLYLRPRLALEEVTWSIS
jgi:hypothetical protein